MALVKEVEKDNLQIKVYDSRESMGENAAKEAAATIIKLLEEKNEINMIFAAAPSQNEVLLSLVKNEEIDWKRINAFHMDEYAGLKKECAQSFGYFLREHIFGLAPFKSVHYIDGSCKNIAKECDRYTQLLAEHPIDVVMLGIGENGHIAFNDPEVAEFDDTRKIKPVLLDKVCRNQQVNDGCFSTLGDVPSVALTLTVPMLCSANYMFCVVPAATKRAAVTKTVTGKISEECPATILRRHKNAILYCDMESGKDIVSF